MSDSTSIASRLEAVVAEIGLLNTQIDELTAQRAHHLFESNEIPAETTAQLDTARARIEQLRLLVPELERRIPAEQKALWIARLRESEVRRAELENQARAALDESKEHFAKHNECIDRWRSFQRQADSCGAFTARNKLESLKRQHPELWGLTAETSHNSVDFLAETI